MVQRQAGGAASLNDSGVIMKGRKRGAKQVEEIMSHRPVCHPLFLCPKCARSLSPPAEVERERERESCTEDEFICWLISPPFAYFQIFMVFFHFYCISCKSKTSLA